MKSIYKFNFFSLNLKKKCKGLTFSRLYNQQINKKNITYKSKLFLNEVYKFCWNNLNFLSLKNNKLLLLNTINYLGFDGSGYNKMDFLNNTQMTPFVGVELTPTNQKWFCLGSYALVSGSLPYHNIYDDGGSLAGPVHDFGFSTSIYCININYLNLNIIDVILDNIQKKSNYIKKIKKNISPTLQNQYINDAITASELLDKEEIPYFIRSYRYEPLNSLSMDTENSFNLIEPTVIFILYDPNNNYPLCCPSMLYEHISKKYNFFSNIYTTYNIKQNYFYTLQNKESSDCLIIEFNKLSRLMQIFENELISLTFWSYLLKTNLNKKYNKILNQHKKFNLSPINMIFLLLLIINFIFLFIFILCLIIKSNYTFHNLTDISNEFTQLERKFNWSENFVKNQSKRIYKFKDRELYKNPNRNYLEYHLLTPINFLNHTNTTSYLNFFGQVTKIINFEFRYILAETFTVYYFNLFGDNEKYFLFHLINFIIKKYMLILNELEQTNIFKDLYFKINKDSIIFPKILNFNEVRLNLWFDSLKSVYDISKKFSSVHHTCIHNTTIDITSHSPAPCAPFFYIFYTNKSDYNLIYNYLIEVIAILKNNFVIPFNKVEITPTKVENIYKDLLITISYSHSSSRHVPSIDLIHLKFFESDDTQLCSSSIDKENLELINFNTKFISKQLELYFNCFL